MNLEAKAFSIPAVVVHEIQRTIQDTGIYGLINSALREMQDKHPLLSSYFEKPANPPSDWNAYRSGRAVGYAAISRALTQHNMSVDLTLEDLEIHHQSVRDYIGGEQSDAAWPEPEFRQRMESSPTFLGYVDSQSGSFHYSVGRQSFSRGVYDAMMPILAVIDRKALEKAIWREEGVKT